MSWRHLTALFAQRLRPRNMIKSGKASLRATAVFGGVALLGHSVHETISEASSSVFAWGSNQYGQLGVGEEADKSAPTPVKALSSLNVVHVDAGGKNSAVLTDDGRLHTFGSAEDDRNGHGDDCVNASTPGVVEALIGRRITSFSCGSHHMAAVDEDGNVFTWGRNTSGQLAQSGFDSYSSPRQADLIDGKAKAVYVGGSQTFVVTDDDRLLVFGNNALFACGHPEKYENGPVELKQFQGKKIKQIACGDSFSMILLEGGEVFSMGSSDFGETGHGNTTDRYTREPKAIRSLSSKEIVQIAAGVYHAAALASDGEVFTWGYGKDGQLGHGDHIITSPLPRRVNLDAQAVQVACGAGHTAALDSDGRVWMWGLGRNGQLGRGDNVESIASAHSRPTPVTFFSSKQKRVVQIALGADHSIALTKDS